MNQNQHQEDRRHQPQHKYIRVYANEQECHDQLQQHNEKFASIITTVDDTMISSTTQEEPTTTHDESTMLLGEGSLHRRVIIIRIILVMVVVMVGCSILLLLFSMAKMNPKTTIFSSSSYSPSSPSSSSSSSSSQLFCLQESFETYGGGDGYNSVSISSMLVGNLMRRGWVYQFTSNGATVLVNDHGTILWMKKVSGSRGMESSMFQLSGDGTSTMYQIYPNAFAGFFHDPEDDNVTNRQDDGNSSSTSTRTSHTAYTTTIDSLDRSDLTKFTSTTREREEEQQDDDDDNDDAFRDERSPPPGKLSTMPLIVIPVEDSDPTWSNGYFVGYRSTESMTTAYSKRNKYNHRDKQNATANNYDSNQTKVLHDDEEDGWFVFGLYEQRYQTELNRQIFHKLNEYVPPYYRSKGESKDDMDDVLRPSIKTISISGNYAVSILLQDGTLLAWVQDPHTKYTFNDISNSFGETKFEMMGGTFWAMSTQRDIFIYWNDDIENTGIVTTLPFQLPIVDFTFRPMLMIRLEDDSVQIPPNVGGRYDNSEDRFRKQIKREIDLAGGVLSWSTTYFTACILLKDGRVMGIQKDAQWIGFGPTISAVAHDDDRYRLEATGYSCLVVTGDGDTTQFGPSFQSHRIANDTVRVYKEPNYGSNFILVTEKGQGSLWSDANISYTFDARALQRVIYTSSESYLGLFFDNKTLTTLSFIRKEGPLTVETTLNVSRIDNVEQVLQLNDSPFAVLLTNNSVVFPPFAYQDGPDKWMFHDGIEIPSPDIGWWAVPSGGGGLGISAKGVVVPLFQLPRGRCSESRLQNIADARKIIYNSRTVGVLSCSNSNELSESTLTPERDNGQYVCGTDWEFILFGEQSETYTIDHPLFRTAREHNLALFNVETVNHPIYVSDESAHDYVFAFGRLVSGYETFQRTFVVTTSGLSLYVPDGIQSYNIVTVFDGECMFVHCHNGTLAVVSSHQDTCHDINNLATPPSKMKWKSVESKPTTAGLIDADAQRNWTSLVASQTWIGIQLEDGRAEFFPIGDGGDCSFDEECGQELTAAVFNESSLHNPCEWSLPSDYVDPVVCDAYAAAEEHVRREGRFVPLSSQTRIDHFVVAHPRVERYGEFVDAQEVIAVLEDLRTIIVFFAEDYQLRFHLPDSTGIIQKVLMISNGFAVVVIENKVENYDAFDLNSDDSNGNSPTDAANTNTTHPPRPLLSLMVFEYGKFWKTVASNIHDAFSNGGVVVYY